MPGPQRREVIKYTSNMVNIFVSYSHKDKSHVQRGSLVDYLQKELKGLAKFWWDKKITTGNPWDEQIHRQILDSQIAIVLISPNFLSSKYIQKAEVNKFMTATIKKFIIFPVILSPCDPQRTDWLSKLQYIPGGNKSIEKNYPAGPSRNKLYKKISGDLKKQVTNIQKPVIAAGQALAAIVNLINAIEPDLLSVGNKKYLVNKTHGLMFEGTSTELTATTRSGMKKIVKFKELGKKLKAIDYKKIMDHHDILNMYYSKWGGLNAKRYSKSTGKEVKSIVIKQRKIVLEMVSSLLDILLYLDNVGLNLDDHYRKLYDMLKLTNKTRAMDSR